MMYVYMLTAVGLAAWAHNDALVGAALVAGGDAGVLPVLGVIAGDHMVPLTEPARVDHVGVLRQRGVHWRLRLSIGDGDEGAQG